MRYVQLLMGTLFCLLFQHNIHAQTLYTWTDATGTIHISQKKPPTGQTLTSQLKYTAKLSPRPEIEKPSSRELGNDKVLALARQAKLERKAAEEARRRAEDAIREANQIKQETETFLAPWRDKKRIRKDMQLQIESRIQKANQVIAKAETLIDAAKKAEEKAQVAEIEAQKTRDQFFEAYRVIVSN